MVDDDVLRKLNLLTERQREILKMVCQGNDYQTIAKELFISIQTVKSHMGNVYEKLGLDLMPISLRKKAIFEIYCPALHEMKLIPPTSKPVKAEAIEPEPVPTSIQKMVDDDEIEFFPAITKKNEIIYIPPPPIEDHKWRRILLLIAILLVVFIASYQVYGWIFVL